MLVRLFVSNDKANVKKVILRSDTLIGRAADCNLRIASQEVSRRHCSIRLVEPCSVLVRDLDSSNGTFVDGRQIESNVDVPVRSGAELEIGNVRFTVNYDAPSGRQSEDSTAEVPDAVPVAHCNREGTAEDAAQCPANEAETTRAMRLPHGPASPAAEDTMREVVAKTVHEPAPEVDVSFGRETVDGERETVDERLLSPESAIGGDAEDSDDSGDNDDDKFAMKAEEDAAPEADQNSALIQAEHETVAMSAEEIGPLRTPAERQPAPETQQQKKSGWKSLFGLFGGGRKEGPSETVAVADETGSIDAADQTLPLPAESAEINDAGDETVRMSADESSPAAEIDGIPDDEDLQDFFKQMSQQ